MLKGRRYFYLIISAVWLYGLALLVFVIFFRESAARMLPDGTVARGAV